MNRLFEVVLYFRLQDGDLYITKNCWATLEDVYYETNYQAQKIIRASLMQLCQNASALLCRIINATT